MEADFILLGLGPGMPPPRVICVLCTPYCVLQSADLRPSFVTSAVALGSVIIQPP